MVWAPRSLDKLIETPREALSVFDFEPVMHKNVPPAHFGYMATGIDDEVTLRANREGFQKFQLLPRRLVDVSQLDLSLELFGQTYGSPSCWRRPAPTRPSMRTAISPSRAPPAGPTTCRSCRPWPRPRSSRRSRHAAGPSGSSSTPPTNGRWPRPWPSAPRRPARRPLSSRSTCWRARTGRPTCACGAPTSATARSATGWDWRAS